jgi:hypothetical protein
MRYEEIKQAYIGMHPHVLNVGNYSIAGKGDAYTVYVYWRGPGAYNAVATFPTLELAVTFAKKHTCE